MITERAVSVTCDIDRTLLAGDWYPEDRPYADAALASLTARIKQRKANKDLPPFYIHTSTGRTLWSHREELEAPEENGEFRHFVETLDTKTGSVGAEIEYRRKEDGLFIPREEWPGELSGWDRQAAYAALRPRVEEGELLLQPQMTQSAVKLSYTVNLPLSLHEGYAEKIEAELLEHQVPATVTFSGGMYLDILPRKANGDAVNKGTAQAFVNEFLAERDNLPEVPIAVFADDGENGEAGFAHAIESGGFGIIPANAEKPFKRKMRERYPETKLYIARTAKFAMAIQEGLERRDIL